jgi:hypothetical protein
MAGPRTHVTEVSYVGEIAVERHLGTASPNVSCKGPTSQSSPTLPSGASAAAVVRVSLIGTAGADKEPRTATCVAHLRSCLGQLFRHIEPCMAGRLAFDPGGNLPVLLLIETRRLNVECG